MSDLWDNLQEGSEPEAREIGPISRTDIVRYQGASGDMNPIHHDAGFAANSGFEKPLGVGMLPAGAMGAWATQWLGPKNIRRQKVRWKAPYFPDDTLKISGKFVRKYEADGERKVDIEMTCTRQDGEVAVLGWATFVVP